MIVPQPATHGSPETQTVLAWHDALNSGDVERLLSLSHPDVEVGGPRGRARGARILREWAGHADIRLEPGRIFDEAGKVVVEQGAEWQSANPGNVQTVTSVFAVSDGLVTSVVRYPDLASALRAADLDASHEGSRG
jgi:ketosteroid isomerase-like protein